MNKTLSHVDATGRARMVDVSSKDDTLREAVARGFVHLAPETVHFLRDGKLKKGDPLETARLAGIMAAKKTSDLIPLCHQLLLTDVDVQLEQAENGLAIEARIRCVGKTGVEMEALTAVAVAALTVYDMCKSVDQGMVISDIRLVKKTGGRRGAYRREGEEP